MRFRTILADPPWEFRVWGASIGMRTASSHYAVQGDEWIRRLPVGAVAAPDATLLLWATNPHLPVALEVVAAWGFVYKSLITWAKMAAAGAPKIGLGYHVRGATEHLVIAQRGAAPAPECSGRPASIFFCPRGEHSAKPDYQYDLAEHYPPPYLEMFHRPKGGMFPPRERWTFIGDGVDGRDIRDALRDLADQPQILEIAA